jgi:hypothetical protein
MDHFQNSSKASLLFLGAGEGQLETQTTLSLSQTAPDIPQTETFNNLKPFFFASKQAFASLQLGV